jgi:hypothetical protein
MKASKIIELLKDLPPDTNIVLSDNQSDYDTGKLTLVYPARYRTRLSYPFVDKTKNEWGSWAPILAQEEYKTLDRELEITSDIPSYYILVDDS